MCGEESTAGLFERADWAVFGRYVDKLLELPALTLKNGDTSLSSCLGGETCNIVSTSSEVHTLAEIVIYY